jgi:NADPH2:quinone reductase
VRAAVCRALGSPDSVRVEEISAPAMAPGHVRVAVSAAAVNFPDVLVVAGTYQVKAEPPFIVGSEFAGVATEVADDVGHVAIGDRVAGSAMVGGFAEEIVVPAAALHQLPASMDWWTAAACGVAHRTAYHVLRSVAVVQPGEELVVLGAGGGVGLAAVQLGVKLGASVTAVASSAAKLDVASSLGATHLIDRRSSALRPALWEVLPHGADAVVDPVGGDLAEPALRSLRPGGRFVTVGYASGVIPRIPLNLVLLKGITIVGFQFIDFATRWPEEMRRNDHELSALLEAGRVLPHVGAKFSLDEVATALGVVEHGEAVGKVVIDVAGTNQ